VDGLGDKATFVLATIVLSVAIVFLLVKDRMVRGLRKPDGSPAPDSPFAIGRRIGPQGALVLFVVAVCILGVKLDFPDHLTTHVAIVVCVSLFAAFAMVMWRIWPVRRVLWLLLRAKLGLPNKQLTWISGEFALGGIIQCPVCRNPTLTNRALSQSAAGVELRS
jgi:hypothetical protein